MKLYYHKTDGGAEYYSTKRVPNTEDEGAMEGVIMRVDGGEIEIFLEKITAQGLTLKVK